MTTGKNIVNQLVKKKEEDASFVENNNVIQEVKLLMDADASEDLRIFKSLGKKHSIALSQDELGKQLQLEKLDGRYEGNVFTKEQIKSLAIKYNLRFLRSKYFTGKMDVEVAAKLKEFSKNTNTSLSDGALEYNAYVLAPESEFSLNKVRTRRMWEPIDPALFYKIDDEHYRLIHKWGADFSVKNRISGIRNANFWSRFSFDFTVVTLLALGVLHYILPQFSYWWAPLAGFLFGYFGQVARMTSGIEADKSKYSPDYWDSETKYI